MLKFALEVKFMCSELSGINRTNWECALRNSNSKETGTNYILQNVVLMIKEIFG